MIRLSPIAVLWATFGTLGATVIDTNNPAIVAAFQTGATVIDFESISGRTPQTINSYTTGDPVSSSSFIFNQIPGVQFSVGGMVGTNEPALYQLSGGIAAMRNPEPRCWDQWISTSRPSSIPAAMIEIFFPTKVSKVGFWLNPALSNVELIAADTNFAFSGLPETNLEIANPVTAGNFVGIQRSTADIGGFKIIGLGSTGFTIDDFTFGGGSASGVPEPGTLVLLGCGLLAISRLRRRTPQGQKRELALLRIARDRNGRGRLEPRHNLQMRATMLAMAFAAALAAQPLTLQYTREAEDWQSQALPIGNGRIGAMIFGGAQHEHLQLNENSLWTGDEKDTGRYQNLADLFLDLDARRPTAYRRGAGYFDRAIHSISYTADGVAYRREYLASAPARCWHCVSRRTSPARTPARCGSRDAHAARTSAAGKSLTAAGKLDNGLAVRNRQYRCSTPAGA